MTPEAVEPGGAGAVGPVVVLAHQPRRAGAAVEAGHALAAGQGHGTVFAAVTGVALAVVVGDVIWKDVEMNK